MTFGEIQITMNRGSLWGADTQLESCQPLWSRFFMSMYYFYKLTILRKNMCRKLD